jgi:hypothetical protein
MHEHPLGNDCDPEIWKMLVMMVASLLFVACIAVAIVQL